MNFRTLIPSYLESNHRESLRHELCEILYEDYKGRTFRLDQMLEEKKAVLEKVYQFFQKHPEISKYKEDSKYWYPYKNVDGEKNLNFYVQFYPNTDDEITYFCKKGEDSFKNSDYLFDPVKLQFFLMCNDIKTMRCEDKTAKKIIKINNELFKILFEKIGDTISYNGLDTLGHINRYIDSFAIEEQATKNNKEYSDEYKEHIINSLHQFMDYSYLVEPAIIVCHADKLSKELPTNIENKNTIKKKV